MRPDIQDLIGDVQRETGVAMSRDDPIIAAALVQASIVREAGKEATDQILNAVKARDEVLLNLHAAAKKVIANDLANTRAEFQQMATSVIDAVAQQAAPVNIKLVAAGMFTTGLAAGMVIAMLILRWRLGEVLSRLVS